MSTRKYHTLEEAARFMSEPVDRVRQRVNDRELPYKFIDGKVMIPAIPLRDFYYDHLLKVRNRQMDSSGVVRQKSTVRSGTGARKSVPSAPSKKIGVAKRTQKDTSDDDQWISSAFSAGKLVGLTPSEVHNLGLAGKIRTRQKGSWIQYYRPDVKSLRPNAKAEEAVPTALPRVYSYPELTEAAQMLGTSVDRVRAMIRAGELVWDPKYELIVPARKASDKPADHRPVNPDPSPAVDNPREPAEPPATGSQENRDRSIARAKKLLDEIPDVDKMSRTEKEHWLRQISRERDNLEEEREKLVGEMREEQYADDRVTAKPGNTRQDEAEKNEALAVELEQERTLRAESEQWAKELHTELDEQRARTLELEEAIRLFGPQRYEREEYEERLSALSAELEAERKRQRSAEERDTGLQARLERSEADNRALREALAAEREKVGRMEPERRLLGEVRRLLAAGEAGTASGEKDGAAPQEATEHGFAGAADTLYLQTPFGQVPFRPPFPLEDHEADLLRLVAREDEITAEQIRNLRGRRAANALDDLLDRFVEAGVHPVRETNDRYSFDPSGLEAD